MVNLNLFIKKGIYILLYIDNLLIIENYININIIKKIISNKWKYKDLDKISIFLNIQIKQNRQNQSLKIYQSNYIKKIL